MEKYKKQVTLDVELDLDEIVQILNHETEPLPPLTGIWILQALMKRLPPLVVDKLISAHYGRRQDYCTLAKTLREFADSLERSVDAANLPA